MTDATASQGDAPPRPYMTPFRPLGDDVGALQTLKARKQWVCWRQELVDGRWTKVPYNARTGTKAASNRPWSWNGYDMAEAAVSKYAFDGVGYVLSDDDDLTAVDLDHVLDRQSGRLDDWAALCLAGNETYGEVSPSGTGVRLFCLGKVAKATLHKPASVEIYGRGRYLTVTGMQLPDTPDNIRPAPNMLAALVSRVEIMKASDRAAREPSGPKAAMGEREPIARQAKRPDGVDFFRGVNEMALARLSSWVSSVFPAAVYQSGTGAYRVSSKALNRDLEEDLSIAPGGIKDFGIADMGDARAGGYTAIDLVMDYGPASDKVEAAFWLCARVGVTPASLGWREAPIWEEVAADAAGDAGAESNAGETAQQADELEIIEASCFDGEPVPQRSWHVPGLVPGRTVTTLNGDGGTGKSLLALQLAVSTAHGSIPWIGQPVAHGTCIFLTAEDEVDEIHRRLADIVTGEEVSLADLSLLLIVPLAGKDALLAVPDARQGKLRATTLFGQVRRAVERYRPELVVLDTLADLFGGNEVDRAQARQFIGMLRGLALDHNATIVLLAHPSLAGISSGTGSSGSTAWNNSVRSRLYLRRVVTMDDKTPVEADPDLRSLMTMKANYSRTGTEIMMRWKQGRFVADRPEPVSSLNIGAVKGKAERVFKELLRSYLAEGRNVSSAPCATYAPLVFSRDERSEGVTKKGFTDAMNRLFARGEIENVQFGPPSHRRSRIEFPIPSRAPADAEEEGPG